MTRANAHRVEQLRKTRIRYVSIRNSSDNAESKHRCRERWAGSTSRNMLRFDEVKVSRNHVRVTPVATNYETLKKNNNRGAS